MEKRQERIDNYRTYMLYTKEILICCTNYLVGMCIKYNMDSVGDIYPDVYKEFSPESNGEEKQEIKKLKK